MNNNQYTKEEYFERVLNIKKVGYKKNADFVVSHIQNNCENVIGNYISNTKSSTYVFDVTESENLKWCSWFHQARDCYDCYSW